MMKSVKMGIVFLILTLFLFFTETAEENLKHVEEDTSLELKQDSCTLPLNQLKGEIIYFVMPDRFNNADFSNDYGAYIPQGQDPDSDAEVLKHGLKKDNFGYYHGGDLKGIIQKLGYLKRLGVTGIWITPVFTNNPVQGDGTVNGSSAAYHGYWITDFLQVDPHLGTTEELKTLVKLAHKLKMKVFLDIITNHTADIIRYQGVDSYDYRSKADYPFLDAAGKSFDDLDYAFSYSNGTPFPELNLNSFAYNPVIPEGKEQVKNPNWLNSPLFYHNRGNSTFSGESSLYGDFVGLDDLFTAHPQVVGGMIEIYKHWIKEFKVDGFRIDTVKHVNIEFWQQFAPEILSFAKEQGIKDFYLFGEVYDGNPAVLSRYTTQGKLPAVLDFGFQSTVTAVISRTDATNALKEFFLNDDFYIDSDSNAYNLPTFLGNHDMGRVGAMIRRDNQGESDDLLLKKDILAHSLMFTARGVPTVYYGDEQGFTGLDNGAIGDKIARQDMFPSLVESYQDPAVNKQIGSNSTPALDNFDIDHPVYRAIQTLAHLRKRFKALSHGTQIHRYSTAQQGGDIYAFSRILRGENKEFVVALNTNPVETKTATIKSFHQKTPFIRVYPKSGYAGKKVLFSNMEQELSLTVAPLEMVVYKALRPLSPTKDVPELSFVKPQSQFESGRFWVETALSYEDFVQVSFYAHEPKAGWRFIGMDDNPPYRVYYDSSSLPLGSSVDFKAVVKNISGKTNSALLEGVKIENRMPQVTVHYENGNNRGGVAGVFSQGHYLFPQPADDLSFPWQQGSAAVTLIYEDAAGGGLLRFDKPIYLSLTRDVYPYLEEVGDGTVKATIYINSKHEIANAPNFTGTLPETLPYDPGAVNPLDRALYLRGGMNGWGTANELVYNGSYTFSGSAILDAGEVEYKFADADWGSFNFGAPVAAYGITRGANPGNLHMSVPSGKGGLYKVNFFYFPSEEGQNGYYGFYRFEKDSGPLGADIYLHLDGALPASDAMFSYTGENRYQLEATLTAGVHSLKLGDLALSPGLTYGAADTGSQPIPLETATPITRDGGYDLLVTAEFEGRYRFILDAADIQHPSLTVTSLVDHGPYGALYLRGGNGIAPEGWGANANNLFSYDPVNQTLNFSTTTVSSSVDLADWQFKIANMDWSFQLTGQSGNWLAPENEVVLGVPYALGQMLETLYIQPSPGTYHFSLAVSDPAHPLLLITKE